MTDARLLAASARRRGEGSRRYARSGRLAGLLGRRRTGGTVHPRRRGGGQTARSPDRAPLTHCIRFTAGSCETYPKWWAATAPTPLVLDRCSALHRIPILGPCRKTSS